jgi:hypothetical protein
MPAGEMAIDERDTSGSAKISDRGKREIPSHGRAGGEELLDPQIGREVQVMMAVEMVGGAGHNQSPP